MRYALLVLACLVAACGGDTRPPFEVSDIEITEPMPGRGMSAGFMTLSNNTDAAIVITNVASPQYGSVQIHESLIEDGIAKMRPIAALEIAPKSELSLERGGLHLMLMRAIDSPDQIELRFYSHDALVLNVAATISRRSN